jgi:hypothetical protein
MAEQTRKMEMFGQQVDVVDVAFKPINEYFNEYELEDGSVLKVKGVATAFIRVNEQFMADGSPIYLAILSPAVRVIKSSLSPKANVEEIQ